MPIRSAFLKTILAILILGGGISETLPATVSEQIIVDQIGYRTNADKWFMIADPRTGQNSSITYVPGSIAYLRRASDNANVVTITLSSFNGGAEYAPAGDVVWQGNFSSYTTPGTYRIYDPTNDRQSYDFEISDNSYNSILKATIKSYYYQRCGTAITAPYGGIWTHNACHVSTQQAANLWDGSNQGQPRNVVGGWHDAGDYRKYVSFTTSTLWDLMHAAEWYSSHLDDAVGIPESGNGVPDLLDECKYELDWLLRMQRTDGALYSGVFVVTGQNGTNGGTGDPSLEDRPYYYANISTAATGTGCYAFALGARLLGAYAPYSSYAVTLQNAAVTAWNYLQANPSNIQYNHSGFDNANANRSAAEDLQIRCLAAAELYHLTGAVTYRNYFDAHYNDPATTENSHQPITSGYFETGPSGSLQRGMVSYCLAPGATASVVTAIKNSLNQGIQNQTYGQRNADAYKAYMWDGHYTWGSNQAKAYWGMLGLWGVKLNVNAGLTGAYNAAAEEYLHYFHGRNPLSWCYLTQSQLSGAEKTITQIYHGWFHEGTSYASNPAPGVLAGGPNASYVTDVGYSGGTAVYPPGGEPRQKAYRNWNVVWPDCSWTVTENGIYYQAKYTFLVAAYAGNSGPTPTPTRTPTSACGVVTCTFTITPTPTWTPTPTRTNTPSPCDLIYDGSTVGARLSDGTVTNSGSGTLTETGTTGNPGNGMRLAFVGVAGWWQELDWNMTTNKNVGANTHLQFNVRQDPASPGSVSQFLVRVNWGTIYPNVANYLVEGGTIDTTWKTARIPLTALLESGQTVLDFVGFINNWNADYTVNVDNLCLTGAVVVGTPTFTPTWTRTFTPTVTLPPPTNTPTVTPSATMSPTRSSTATATRSATPTFTVATNTFTVTSTSTRTNTASFTPTFTVTRTNTNTFSPTFTFTATATLTRTVTATASPTRTFTVATNTFTATSTVTRTNSPTFTPTFTVTRTNTPTNTVTSTLSPTFTFTSTNTVTRTATATVTRTNTIFVPTTTFTSTATQTRTNTFTATPTATSTFTRTFTLTPTVTLSPTRTSTATSTWTGILPTSTPTLTYTNTFTATATLTRTNTATTTYTRTNTFTSTITSSPTRTNTATSTWTGVLPTSTPTATVTDTLTATRTLSRTATPTASTTPTPSATPTLTATLTRTSTFSFTPTVTLSPTRTSTATSTWTGVLPTNTPTPSYTNTWTATATLTRTNTFTPTYSVTSTFTLLPSTSTPTASFTVTRTWTATPSDTMTFTYTATPTASITPTPSAALTATPSASPTLTATSTFTRTPTITDTPTETGTPTPTFTGTASPSATFTTTRTPSATPTATATESATLSPTASLTWSSTLSPTSTLTHTVTRTFTLSFTPTRTWTPTNTGTSTHTPTWTLTSSFSLTPTYTHTPTYTFTPTYSVTSTFTLLPSTSTPTASLTPTLSFTPTYTWTSVFTNTPSFTWTPTFSPTPTETPEITSTPSWTSTPHSTFLIPNSTVVPYPNPCSHPCETVKVNVTVAKSGDVVTIQLFTTAFRKISETTLTTLPVGVTPVQVVLRDKKGILLSNGVYYIRVISGEEPSMGKMVILR